jgi:hypothetical protein
VVESKFLFFCFNHPDPCKPGHPSLKEEGGEIKKVVHILLNTPYVYRTILLLARRSTRDEVRSQGEVVGFLLN